MKRTVVLLLLLLIAISVAVASDPVTEVVIPSKMSPVELVQRTALIFSRHQCQVRYANESLGVITGEVVRLSRHEHLVYTVHVSTDKDSIRILVYFGAMHSTLGSKVSEAEPELIQPIVDELKKLGATPVEATPRR